MNWLLIEPEGVLARGEGGPLVERLADVVAGVGPHLAALRELGACCWFTQRWRYAANDLLAPHLRLPRCPVWVPTPGPGRGAPWERVAYLQAHHPETMAPAGVVWIEPEASAAAARWCAAHGRALHLAAPAGLDEGHVAAVRDFLARPRPGPRRPPGPAARWGPNQGPPPIVVVTRTEGGTAWCSCGHVLADIYPGSAHVGQRRRCVACRDDRREESPRG